jgi:hypothetical protein
MNAEVVARRERCIEEGNFSHLTGSACENGPDIEFLEQGICAGARALISPPIREPGFPIAFAAQVLRVQAITLTKVQQVGLAAFARSPGCLEIVCPGGRFRRLARLAKGENPIVEIAAGGIDVANWAGRRLDERVALVFGKPLKTF